MSDRKVIICNYTEGTNIATEGAKAYVSPIYLGGNLPERVLVLVRSRSGRWVEKWENMRRLDNFRLAALPPEHPRYDDDRVWIGVDMTGEQVERLRGCKREIGA